MTAPESARLRALREQLHCAYDPLLRGYHRLMEKRVRTVLLVSSAYESFSLSRDVNLEYAMLGTSQALRLKVVPQITTAVSGSEALRKLAEGAFDLVLASPNLCDLAIDEFAAAVKARHPGLPVVLITFDSRASDPDAPQIPGVDWSFAWRGNASVILSIVKLAEDRANVDRDIELASVGTLLVVEDAVERYSALLPELYTILIEKTLALTPEGINENDRQLRTRVRPKVLLARTFEEAERLVEKYSSSLLGVISDLHTDHDDRTDPRSGERFLERLVARHPVPVLIQSSDPDAGALAARLGARLLEKSSSRTLAALEQFVLDDVGFGSFAFKDAGGQVHARVSSLWEMERALATVPDSSILYHAGRDELSRWLRARGETSLAAVVRPIYPADFDSVAQFREYVCAAVAIARREKHRGVIADFQEHWFDPTYPFLTIGKGSLGGKGRGLAFMFHLFSQGGFGDEFPGVRVRIPNTLVITTEEFDTFLQGNELDPAGFGFDSDREVRRRICAGRLSEPLRQQLRIYLERVHHPLAVRSSSLLEDSHDQPCAGLYATYLLPNNHPDLDVRLEQLCLAIQLVYASVFLESPRRYRQSIGVNPAEEKMAVVIQEVFGRAHGERFYPTFSGVAQSYNYYSVMDMKPEEGAAMLALGLGKHVVEGGQALRYCPAYPHVLPQFCSLQATLRASQRDFWALDLASGKAAGVEAVEQALVRLPLSKAEEDGELQWVGSVISSEDDRIYDGLNRRGARVVTFAQLRNDEPAPFSRFLQALLSAAQTSFGGPVEMEFAANLSEDEVEFGFLQVRPFVAQRERRQTSLEGIDAERILCGCQRAMGHGRLEGLRDLVYLHPERFERAASGQVVTVLAQLNARLAAAGRRYVLVGPGRWGTLDPWLGVPVAWYQISGAKLIAEVPLRDLAVEPSQGTHFFHNLVSAGVAYFSLPAYGERDFVRWPALEALPGETLEHGVRHVTLERPLEVRIDGRTQQGVIALG